MKERKYMALKHIAFILSITMLISFVPLEEFVIAASNTQEQESTSSENLMNVQINNPSSEIKSMRTETSKTYLNNDGTYTSEISQSPIHFRDEHNEWESINNDLVQNSKEDVYENKANDFKVKFDEQQQVQSPIMKIEDDQYSTEIKLESLDHTGEEPKSVNGVVDGESITYPNVYSDINLKYTVGSDRVKEDIIYSEKPKDGFPSQFTYKMNLEGMGVKEESGILYLYDPKSNKPIYYFETPYMFDSYVPEGFKSVSGVTSIPEEAISYDVNLTYEIVDNQLYLHLKPSKGWLEDSNRVYPITIDPTIVRIQSSSVEDTNIRSAFPTQTGGNDLEIGGGASNGNIIRSLLKFDLSNIPAATNILSSSLNIWFSSTNNSTPISLSLYKASRNWNENEASWNYAKITPSTAWTNPGGDYVSSNKLGTLDSLTSPTNLENEIKRIDVPIHIIQNWKNDPSTNYGFMFKSDSETTNVYKKFISSESSVDSKYKPLLVVTYRTNARLGLEDYWLYDSHSLIGGSSYSNLTTNNNVIQYNDFSVSGRGDFGLDFNRTYNSKSYESSAMGYGWTFTGNEKLFLNIKGTANIINYQDEDGTDHEFNYDSANSFYKSGPGKYLTIKKSTTDSNIYIMEDKEGVRTTFKVLQTSNDTNVRVAYIQSKKDSHGNTLTYSVDPNTLRLTKISNDLGNGVLKFVQFTYNQEGYIEKVEYEGNKFVYHYINGKIDYVDQFKNDDVATRTQFKYKNDRISTVIDPNGRLTDYIYDENGYLIKVQDPLDGKDGMQNDPVDRPGTVYNIDNASKTTKVIDPEGNITTYYFDDNYVAKKIEDSYATITYTFDTNYNAQKIVTNDETTTNTYDENGNLLSTTDGDNNIQSYSYYADNRIESMTDSNGNKTTITYKKSGDEEVETITSSDGKVEINTYDKYGDLKSVTHADGSIENMTIDYSSNLITSSKTDSFGNLTKVINDSVNNTSSIIDGRGNSYVLQYNNKDELTTVIDQRGNSTSYKYDNNGNLLGIENAKHKTTNYQYDGQNQLKGEVNSLGEVTKYSYDDNGNLTTTLLPNGHSIINKYDDDKIQSKQLIGTLYNYEYDPTSGNLLNVKLNNNLLKSFHYNGDEMDYILDRGNKLAYSKLDDIRTLTYTVGSDTTKLDFSLDSLNRISSIRSSNIDDELVKYNYLDESLPTSVNYKNGSSLHMEYIKNRLDKYTMKTSESNVLNSYKLEYDKNNNITSVIANNGITSYKYADNTDQLIKEILPTGMDISYEYDDVGNRTAKVINTPKATETTLYEYNDINQLIKVGAQDYKYDKNGNLLNDGKYTYLFNDLNQLSSVKNEKGQIIATYVYDNEGRRISTTTPSGTLNFFYSGDNVLYETDGNDKKLREYTYNENGQVETMTKGTDVYYYLYNYHGDVIALTDAGGNVVASYTYDSFGNILSKEGPLASENPYRYAGYRYDENTKLYYVIARYYNADNGVFLSVDPLRGDLEFPETLNGYNYASNNPVMYIDPNGHNPIIIRVLQFTVVPILKYLAKKYGPALLKKLNYIVKDKIYPYVKKFTKDYIVEFGVQNSILKIRKKSGKGDTRIFSFDYHALRFSKGKKFSDRKAWHYHISNPKYHYVFRFNDEYASGYSLPKNKYYVWV